MRLFDLMQALQRDSFHGIGKPEPLKHYGPDVWSRCLAASDRLIYRIERDQIVLMSARGHYDR